MAGNYTCNLKTWEAEAKRSGVQGYPWLQNKFKTNQGHMKPFLKDRAGAGVIAQWAKHSLCKTDEFHPKNPRQKEN